MDWSQQLQQRNSLLFTIVHLMCTKPVNIDLSSPDSADEQCGYNRTGLLCGMCQEDLSLVFGS